MDRRTFLTGAAGALSVSTVGLSGCLGSGSDDGSPADWIPAPDLFGADGYRAFSTSPASLAEIRDSLTPSVVDAYRSRILDWQVADPGLDDVARYTSGEKDESGYVAVEHDLDTGTLASNLRDSGFSESGEHGGFDLYETDDGASARGLADGRLVAGVDTDGGGDIVERVIDAEEGDATRYHGANSAVGDVVETIDTTDNFWIEGYRRITNTVAARGVFRGSVARGYSVLLDAETVGATRVEAFVGDTDVQSSAIETYTDENPLFDGAEGTDWRVDDRLLVIEWTADPGALTLRQLG